MNQRPLGPEGVCVRLSNGFRRFSALSARTEVVWDGHDSMDSGYSGQEYGQVCGQDMTMWIEAGSAGQPCRSFGCAEFVML